MENTKENKAKFFSQYWGQNLISFGYVDWEQPNKNYEVNLHYMMHYFNTEQKDLSFYQYLELTPLSKITDEDAIRVWNIMNLHHPQPDSTKVDLIKGIISRKVEGNNYLWLRVFGFLRLCKTPYAIPYNGLSVETLIEYGWIKLK